jgi:hypothetical protein
MYIKILSSFNIHALVGLVHPLAYAIGWLTTMCQWPGVAVCWDFLFVVSIFLLSVDDTFFHIWPLLTMVVIVCCVL